MRDPIETLLEQTSAATTARRSLPDATYRLQFSADFTFQMATSIVPYLAELGITHCYASPYLKARPHSQHGYDIIDHRQLNPEVGSDADFAAWVAALRDHGLRQILDMVPNHMGIVGNENPWWNDVLENGQASPFAEFFDIDWAAQSRPELLGRVLLPILGDPYGQVLESQQLRLEFNAGAFYVWYFDHRFPITPRTYNSILEHRFDDLARRLVSDDQALLEYQSVITAIKHLPHRTDSDPAHVAERLRENEVIKRRLATLVRDSAAVREHIDSLVSDFNGKPGEPLSFEMLHRLLDDQPYRLSYWRVAADEINYRRFFDINELAALNMEREDVFTAAHGLVLQLLAKGDIAGLRIDHVDGLFDPNQYLQRLQQHYVLTCAKSIFDAEPAYRSLDWATVSELMRGRAAEAGRERDATGNFPLYVVVEKILGPGEDVPDEWPVYGTSGYEFLNMVNGLFVANTAAEFTRLYHDWIGDNVSFAETVYRQKRLVMQTAMSSELQVLAYQLDRLAQQNRWSRDFTRHSLLQALREVIAFFPVYRTYITGEPIRDVDRKRINQAVRSARLRNPAINAAIFQFIRDTLLLKAPPHGLNDAAYRAGQLRFAGKFQQVTSPVMAKGVEDAAFYVFNRLLSLNEVGGDPDRFGISPSSFHTFLKNRQSRWPRAFSTTATHDTKRGEDLRARLDVLSEIPDEWRAALNRWSEMNRSLRIALEDESAPDANEELFLYQTLVGAWPYETTSASAETAQRRFGLEPIPAGRTEPAASPGPEFAKRIQEYMHKALNEAKIHSSWINPNPLYDDAIQRFVADILNPEKSMPFLTDMRNFVRRVAHFGLMNSLGQTLIKLTAPGVPDTYQGTELWDFGLVDPDNRRPVDFSQRAKILAKLTQRTEGRADWSELIRELVSTKEDGGIKLYLTWRSLNCRREHPGLFSEGEYLQIEPVGAQKEHVFCFARRLGQACALVVVPRLLVGITSKAGQMPLGLEVWGDTRLALPEGLRSQRWRNVLTGEQVSGGPELKAATLLKVLPVALLVADG
jgi:(1->4)-alpha-D-glucan 1-alpha-D-glucosylmutase